MMGNMTLGDLIKWLKEQNADDVVLDGFGSPHSDRGDYSELAFKPVEKTTFGEMLKHAESAVGKKFTGYKGGEYIMREYTSVYIGCYGDCGDEITPIHFKYWLLTTHLA